MSSDIKRPWTELEPIALNLARTLAPACVKIAIAGSARRGKSEVSDVEIVVISRILAEGNALHWLLDVLLTEGMFVKAKLGESQRTAWGEKYRALEYQGVKFDFFFASAETYGYIYWLRTGPDEANQYAVTRVKNHNAPFALRDGAVWLDKDTRVPVRDEDAMFRLLGIPYIKPGERSRDAYQTLFTAEDHRWGDPTAIVAEAAASDKTAAIQWDERYAHPSGKIWVHDQHTYTVTGEWGDYRYEYKNTDHYYVLLPRTHPWAQHEAAYLQKMPAYNTDWYYRQFQLWLESEILLADAVCLPLDSLMHYSLSGFDTKAQILPLSKIIPTQSVVGAALVAEYIASRSIRSVHGGTLPFGIQFKGDGVVYMTDGHHRLEAARRQQMPTMPVDVQKYPQTLAEALADIDAEAAQDGFLASVLEEAYEVIAQDAQYA